MANFENQISTGPLEVMMKIHQSELFRYLRYLGAATDAVEDILQDTFLAAFRAANQPDEQDVAAQSAWLRVIARNQFLMHCRKQKSGKVVFSSEAVEAAERTWKDVFLRESDGYDYIQALRGCLKKLPEKSSQVVALFYEQKKSRKELAEQLSRSEDGIKSMLRAARSLLSDCIERTLKAGS